jgi:hypothetical protein
VTFLKNGNNLMGHFSTLKNSRGYSKIICYSK